VEDEENALRQYARMLDGLVVVRPAPLVAVAFEILRGPDRIDAMLVDIGLPDGSGFEVIREARQLRPGLPMAIASGHSDADLITEAAAEAIPYLIKTQVSRARLRELVDRLLGVTPPPEVIAERVAQDYAMQTGIFGPQVDILVQGIFGRSVDETAEVLQRTVRNVRYHRTEIQAMHRCAFQKSWTFEMIAADLRLRVFGV